MLVVYPMYEVFWGGMGRRGRRKESKAEREKYVGWKHK
jgi:hypothetical protein